MGEPTEFDWLYRYTNLASALDIVRTGELTLLNPRTWPDQNDVYYLTQYEYRLRLTSLCALCFTSAAETSHHWSSFAPGGDGVRLLFDRTALERDLNRVPGATLRKVEYYRIDEIDRFRAQPELWPFLKRHPYRGEEEVRALYCSRDTHDLVKRVALSPGTLIEVALSPNLPPGLKGSVAESIRGVSMFPGLRFIHSTLLANSRWMGAISAPAEVDERDA